MMMVANSNILIFKILPLPYLILLLSLFFKEIQGQKVKCYQNSDCSSGECCIQGECNKITDDSILKQCNKQKICYATQCQYRCCNSNNECGNYSQCSQDQQSLQITVSIIIGCIVFLILICYVYVVCRKRRNRSEVVPQDYSSNSNIDINNPHHLDDNNQINQTNVNQTQLHILNPNHPQYTEQLNTNNNYNNNLSIVSKPTHVLPPIQTIFLIQQQDQNQPIFVQKNLDLKEIDSINHSMQGTRVSKEYFNRKKKNRQSQRGNSLNQSNIIQNSSIQDQRRSQDEQIVSFNRIDQSNLSQLPHSSNANESNQPSSQKNDLLKNPNNYLYQILRSMREQVFQRMNKNKDKNSSQNKHNFNINNDNIKQNNESKDNRYMQNEIKSQYAQQNENKQQRYQNGMSIESSRNRRKIVSLHHTNGEQRQNRVQLNEEEQYYSQNITQNEYRQIQNQRNENLLQPDKSSLNPTIKYQGNLNIESDHLSAGQQNLLQTPHQDILSTPHQDILQTPHQDILQTPHTGKDYSQRYLNPCGQKESEQFVQEKERNSIDSNNLINLLQNQILGDNTNHEEEQTNRNKKEERTERKSEWSNSDDIVEQINKIYNEDDYNIEPSIAPYPQDNSQTFPPSQIQDLNQIQQIKSYNMSDSIYQLEQDIDNLDKRNNIDQIKNNYQIQANLTFKQQDIDCSNSIQHEELEEIKHDNDQNQFKRSQKNHHDSSNIMQDKDFMIERQGQFEEYEQIEINKQQFKLSKLVQNQSNLKDSISNHPRILTLSQIQNNNSFGIHGQQ